MLDFSRCRPVPVAQEDGSVVLAPPFEHVKQGVEWVLSKPDPYALLANDMGGSKSAQAIISALFLFERGDIDRVIVVAPAAVRPRVWFSEELGELGLHLWDDVPSLVSEYHAKIRQWRRGPSEGQVLKWICTNYEWIRGKGKLEPLMEYCGPRTLLILDESTAVKGRDSAQTEACMAMRWKKWGVPRCGWILLLNGTPQADGPEDLFSQGNLLHPDIHGCRYITHYRNTYAVMEDVRGAGGRTLTDPYGRAIRKIAGWRNLEQLNARFAPHVLRQDWRAGMDLPIAMPPQILTVPLKASWPAYRDMRDEMVHWLESGDVAVSQTAATRVMRLAQVTSGILGGVESGRMEEFQDDGLMESLGLHIGDSERDFRDFDVNRKLPMVQRPEHLDTNPANYGTAFVGREKLDFLLDWQADRLSEDPALKLLVWCRFVPELRRYLTEARERFGHPVGAVCGQLVFEENKTVKREREIAERMLHPRTAEPGAATVGGVYGAGGLGLNFTAFATVFNLSQVYEDWKRKQADKRVDRPGQRRAVVQFDLVAEGPKGQKTIDHVVLAARRAKSDLNEWTAAAWATALKEE